MLRPGSRGAVPGVSVSWVAEGGDIVDMRLRLRVRLVVVWSGRG